MQAYDPLDYTNLANSVVQALLGGPDEPLPPREMFEGSGVYAIYYHGKFSAYRPLVELPDPRPIYVRQSSPDRGQKGWAPPAGGQGTLSEAQGAQ